jgi:type IX secretion system PorP/SprF family membrane protein
MKKGYSKIYLIIAFFGAIMVSYSSYGQQRPGLTQYMFNGLVLNPAYAGIQNNLSMTAMYRDQWVNLDGAPKTVFFTGHSGFKKTNVGVGFQIYSDRIGVHDDVGIYGSYAYKIKLNNGSTLSMGLQGGFNNRISDWNRLTTKDASDNYLSGVMSNFAPNFGTGLLYNTNTFYAGFSVPYILENRIINEVEFQGEGKEARYYYLTAGKLFDLSEKIQIKPSGLLRIQENMPIGLDINTNMIFDNIVSVGFSYRTAESYKGDLIMLFELMFNDNFRFGYAYDLISSGLGPHNRGTHEFMVNYRITIKKIHRTIPCPSFI